MSGNGNNTETNAGALIDDERYFSTVVHTNEGMDTSQTIGSGGSGSNGSHGSSGGTQTPPSRTPNPGGSAPAGAPPTSSAKSQSS